MILVSVALNNINVIDYTMHTNIVEIMTVDKTIRMTIRLIAKIMLSLLSYKIVVHVEQWR